MSKPKCEDCYYAAPSTFPDKDGKKWYSCRFTPPMPYADEKQSMYKDWRIVPEDFWCGKYARKYASHYDEIVEKYYDADIAQFNLQDLMKDE